MPICLKISISTKKVVIIKLLFELRSIAEMVKKIASQSTIKNRVIIRVESGLVKKNSKASIIQSVKVNIKVKR